MRAFTAVIERCPDTGLFVGYVPGFHGAHSQGETLDELQRNLAEVIAMLLEDGNRTSSRSSSGLRKCRWHNHAQAAGAEAARGCTAPGIARLC